MFPVRNAAPREVRGWAYRARSSTRGCADLWPGVPHEVRGWASDFKYAIAKPNLETEKVKAEQVKLANSKTLSRLPIPSRTKFFNTAA